MSDAYSATKGYIGRDVLHSFGVQSGLEFGAHESIALTRVNEAKEMNGKHGHIKCGRNDNQAEDSRNDVLSKETLA